MYCPFCKHKKDKVIDSRTVDNGLAIRRRRQCLNCKKRYTSYERREENPKRVIKKDGRIEMFSRDKIRSGLLKACEKRPVPMAKIDETTTKIELDVYEHFDDEVSSKYIGELVMKELRELDQIAYVRFASVYREFKDINEFMKELLQMLGKNDSKIKRFKDSRI
ncbi:MAG: transcriptional repressor NrdR [Planctomycetes bacterium]|nr:transcriptional repressor NrdR [Planctomycetota bacterium]